MVALPQPPFPLKLQRLPDLAGARIPPQMRVRANLPRG